ncbi:MAG: SDR family NAD(P)-dependent oxidoreductase [Ignavibacteriales bacterium]
MDTALITGASGGIGFELAGVMAREGYNLVLAARNEKELMRLKNELESRYGVSVRIFAKDLSVIDPVYEIFNALKSEGIIIDVLVNNAGFGDYGPFIKSDPDTDLRMIGLNVTTLVLLTRLFAEDMAKRRHGRILNVASTAAFQPGPLMAVYYASKAFVLSFSEAIANELKDKNVTVTALCPGPTVSGFQKAAHLEGTRLFKERKLPDSKEVAEFGYNAMMKGKTVAIHGILNSFVANVVRFFPRNLVTSATRSIQEKTKKEV